MRRVVTIDSRLDLIFNSVGGDFWDIMDFSETSWVATELIMDVTLTNADGII